MEAGKEYCTIPVWRPGPDGLRSYLDQLEVCKELNYFSADTHLIYTSLCRSDRQDIFQQLSKQEKSSLEEYAKFLDSNYGRSLHEKKRQFTMIRQNQEEDENAWFHRVIREYFSAKGTKRPANSQFSSENKSDITLAFIAGLRSTDLKRIMKLRMDDTDDDDAEFFKLGKICQRKALSLRELNSQVYSVAESQIF